MYWRELSRAWLIYGMGLKADEEAMIRNRYNQIRNQTDIEIKDGIMYKTARRERVKRTAISPVDCHQTSLNKANKRSKTNRKPTNNDN